MKRTDLALWYDPTKMFKGNFLMNLASCRLDLASTGWKVSKYGVLSDPYFSVFGLNTGKYGPEKTPYLDTLWKVDTFSSYCLLFNAWCSLKCHTTFNCSKSTVETLKKAWNMLKVNNKDTRTTLVTSISEKKTSIW